MAVNITFKGNVGKDPETYTFQNGHSLTTFSVGVAQGYFDQQHQWQDQGTMWITVECSPTAAQHLPWVRKGAKVIVTGLLSQRFYTKKDGSQGSELRVYAQALGFQHKQQQQQDSGGQPPQQGGYTPQPQQQQPAPPSDPWADNSYGNDPEDPAF